MNPFDKHLRDIDSYINVTDADRKPYTSMYDNVRDCIIAEMKKLDVVFRELFAGTSLFGR